MQEYGTENQDVIGNILAYLISEDKLIGRTRLIKTPYIADLVYFNLCDEFITGDSYLIKPHGPMGFIAKYLTESKYGCNQQSPYFSIIPKSGATYSSYLFKLSEERVFDISKLSESEIMTLDASLQWANKRCSVDDISDFTHEFKMWDEKRVNSRIPIPKSEFSLDAEDIGVLKSGGILVTEFGRDACNVAKHIPRKYMEMGEEEIDTELRFLSRTFPENIWDKYEDCFLSSLDAIRETAISKEAAETLPAVCEHAKAMHLALAYTKDIDWWVNKRLKHFTDDFDKAASDAIGFLEDREPVSEDIQKDVNEILENLKKDALRELNGE
ncbi:MAG: DUF4065 domain-containing protein [Clostridium lundense]|nr:DUF4065 domain-containing protein [Clostridium lundense]